MQRRGFLSSSLAALALLGFSACGGGDATTETPGEKPLQIAVIPKGTTHIFWQSVHAGARKAEKELNAAGTNVAITWKGPLKEDDRVSQIEVVQSFVAKRTDAIVLAPLDKVCDIKSDARPVRTQYCVHEVQPSYYKCKLKKFITN